MEVQYRKNIDADDISITIQSSKDLSNWENATLELVTEELIAEDGIKVMTFRSQTAITENSSNYFRFKVSL